MQLVAEHVAFKYKGETETLFQGVSEVWKRGTVNALRGPSGSGKSTLLDILGGLRRPNEGTVSLQDDESTSFPVEQLQDACSWVLQNNLSLSKRSVIDNVMIAALIRGMPHETGREKALEALNLFGLLDTRQRAINSLSGGEQQRVTIARCLLAPADVILADEPTGNLDSINTKLVVDGLRVAAKSGKIVIVATHDEAVVDGCDSVLNLARY